jgi:hypothetical protein
MDETGIAVAALKTGSPRACGPRDDAEGYFLPRHCEERSDEAIQQLFSISVFWLGCFSELPMGWAVRIGIHGHRF